ncbi:MAG: hypothetical protein LBP30_01860 [Clostridiales Family XIII bacterium]|jgi:hypothetical protein|nr:hypothetical protein [Clostridiales Family XIII bacterium]
MAMEALKNKRGMTIGYTESKLNGEVTIFDKRRVKIGMLKPQGNKLIAYDKVSKKLGYWDERGDATYDAKGKRISRENTLLGFYSDALDD